MLYMFRTILVPSGATLEAVHRIWYVPVYAGIYQMLCTAYKVAPEGTNIVRNM